MKIAYCIFLKSISKYVSSIAEQKLSTCVRPGSSNYFISWELAMGFGLELQNQKKIIPGDWTVHKIEFDNQVVGQKTNNG